MHVLSLAARENGEKATTKAMPHPSVGTAVIGPGDMIVMIVRTAIARLTTNFVMSAREPEKAQSSDR